MKINTSVLFPSLSVGRLLCLLPDLQLSVLRRPDPSLVVFRFVLSFVFHIGHQPFCFQPARLCVSAVRFSYDL